MRACSFPPAKPSSLQFEQFNQPVANSFNGFLHLDFQKDGTIRIDDLPGTVFGTFPHDEPFIVQVTLNVVPTPTAHIVLAGAGTSGQKDYAIQTPLIPLARQFGAVRLWMGFPWTGPFDATTLWSRNRNSYACVKPEDLHPGPGAGLHGRICPAK